MKCLCNNARYIKYGVPGAGGGGKPTRSIEGEKVFVDGSEGVSMRKNRTWYYPERLVTNASVDDVLIY